MTSFYYRCNSLMTWLPFVANDYFASTKSSDNIGLCDVLGDNDAEPNYNSSGTDIFVSILLICYGKTIYIDLLNYQLILGRLLQ